MDEKPSTTLSGTVEALIESPEPGGPEKAQISITGDELHRDIRIENTLTNENGDEVSLKKGAEVKITIES